jgi:tetratricopeptide (TPR) repeat protein/transcriptional regulator with XRE-family HTH domain
VFGGVVAEYRRKLALTQEELAERTGLSVRTIRGLESVRGRVPRQASVRLLADAFELVGAERERFIQLATGADVPRRESGPATPAELPADVAAFVGRDAELARLDRIIDGEPTATQLDGAAAPAGPATAGVPAAVVISAVSGTAGVGKTALAVRWAHRVADRFPDGQLYVNLRGYDRDEPLAATEALARLLGAMGVTGPNLPPTVDERAARYRSALVGRRMLILLDNASTVDQVRPLLPGTGSCAVVVTSRDSLAGLAAVNGVGRLDLDVLPEADAMTLLRRLIGGRVEAEPDAANTLAELCDRLPLALRIAAELAVSQPDTPLAKLVTELTDQRRVERLALDGDPHAAVSTVFSWSIQRLPAAAAALFRLLGLRPGDEFDGYVAAALAGTDVATAEDNLDLLARAHLVQTPAAGRYRMHDLLRTYAYERAVATDATQVRRDALTRLFDYYVATAAAALDVLAPAEAHRRPRGVAASTPIPALTGQDAAVAWLDAERATLVAVAAYTATHGWPTQVIRLSAILYRYLLNGHHADALTIHGFARDAAERQGDRSAMASALSFLAAAQLSMSRYQPATEHLRAALVLFQEVGDLTGEARALANLGIIEQRLGHYRPANEYHERARERYRQVGDRLGEAGTLLTLGINERELGHFERSVEQLRQAVELFQQIGYHAGEASALNDLAVTELRLGQHELAVDHLHLALVRYRQIGSRSGESAALDSLGMAYTRLGRPAEAAEHHREALDIARETGDRYAEPWALNGLGEAAQAAGQFTQARIHHDAALTAAVAIGASAQRARAHAGLGHAHRALGNAGDARQHYQQALAIVTELDSAEAVELRARVAELDRQGR